MKSPKAILTVFALVASLLAAPAAAQSPETFNFPQEHDTVFGDNLVFGNFHWFQQGQGVHGRRTVTGFDTLDAFGFNLLLQDSCIFAGTSMTLDVYVNDHFVGNVGLPSQILCNSAAGPIQGTFDLSGSPIAGLGTGKEFDIRFQLTGQSSPPCCGFAVFYNIDTNNSTIAMAGHMSGGSGGGGGDNGGGGSGGGGGGGGGTVDNSAVLDRIGVAESNLTGSITGEATTTRSAIQQVKDSLGIVEGHVDASIASAVLRVNGETALGIEKLAAQLGVPTQDLAFAIKGNGDATAKIQKTIEDKLLPEVLKANQGIAITQASVEKVGNSFLEQVLSAGTGILSAWSGGALLPVAGFLQQSILSVVNGALRPDKIVNKAMAEFNRGLKRIKKLFAMNNGPAFSLPSDRNALEAMTFGMAADAPPSAADIPFFVVDEKYDQMLGPDKEEDNAFGAFIWFSRAYQTLTRPDRDNGNHYAYGHDKDDGHEPDRASWAQERSDWERLKAQYDQDKANWAKEKADLLKQIPVKK